MPDHAQTIMLQLKHSTRDLHTYAENRPLQKALAKGELPREVFAAYLAQLLWVHGTLEHEIRSRRNSDVRLAALFLDDQAREPNLRADLTFHGVDVDLIEPLPATERLIAQIEAIAATDPVALLGMLYVLEGSNNGSKFIARSLTRAYGIEAGPDVPGLSYLDPYGDNQMPRWQEFKRAMDAAGFTNEEEESIIEAAKLMFRAIADISDAVNEPVGV